MRVGGSVRADDPVTRHDHRDRVRGARRSDGSHSLRMTDSFRDVAIAEGLSEGDGRKVVLDGSPEPVG